MKLIFLACLIIGSCIAAAQPRVLEHAIIITKAKLTTANSSRNFSSFDDNTTITKTVNGMSEGDNLITTYYKGSKIKVTSNFNMGTNTIIIDKKTQRTVTLIEVMGIKTGFYSTEENVKQMERIADSILKKNHNVFLLKDNRTMEVLKVDSIGEQIEYINDNKTIAGLNCKKALIKTSHYNGTIDSMYVWYCPDLKLEAGFNVPTGIAGNVGLFGLELLNGFPMKYEITNINGDKIDIEVKKINTTKEIKDKEFEVPKGFNLKPMNNFTGPYQTNYIR